MLYKSLMMSVWDKIYAQNIADLTKYHFYVISSTRLVIILKMIVGPVK